MAESSWELCQSVVGEGAMAWAILVRVEMGGMGGSEIYLGDRTDKT